MSPDPDAADMQVVAAIQLALAAHGDADRAVGQQRYMKSSMPFHGVTMGQMRRVVGPILREPAHLLPDRATWEATVRALYDGATHREQRHAAIELAMARRYRSWHDAEALDLVAHLVTVGAWWDLVDATAGWLGQVLAAHPVATRARLRQWARADDMWLRRVAIIAQLRAREDTDVALLEEVIDANLEGSPFGSEFFVRKAIGWALRQYARTDPEWVRGFVAQRGERLSGLSRREALKHL